MKLNFTGIELGLRPDNPTVHSALQEKKLTFLDVVN
jgi:hypothetical protein